MKPLTVRIAERVAATYPPSSPAKNLAKFILLREDILQAIQGGWSLLGIWTTLHDEGSIDFGYQAFRRYAKRLLPVHCGDQ
ncbi:MULTISPECIES: TraK family protein [Pseudomonas]|jgi:hypothetical protein|uniref:TraK family protein n=1 Tax=Pseudomonas juntendi TaxID=2666183 RepID=A0AAJ5V3W7_9PSED|nr:MULTISPECIES: TraK family protein [Pseudomonas]CAI3792294.1 hypothetical protein DBADOPDK_00445 [Pseudomonas sp. MM223]CAI3792545.1 hypothetical protein GLGCALEP_00456 [Pseudomonas sp. MM221]EKT4568144.1 TraK family protein [Pseudomonas putida]MBF8757909.1 TraK family protein [Pseudomonas guariconensis]MCE1009920.1 TraK family protein [Pseudomonas monteilii]